MHKIEEKNYHPWLLEALNIGKQMEKWHEISPSTEQAEAWENYFRRLGWHPLTFRGLDLGHTWTAPCEWPEHIETQINWRPGKNERRQLPLRSSCYDPDIPQKFAALMDRLSSRKPMAKQRPAYCSLTNDELRALYHKHEPKEAIDA